jgi:hypothetical protein
MSTISKEIKILAPVIILLLIGMVFSILNKRLISNALLFYISAIYFLIIGFYWILKDRNMSTLDKFIWLLVVFLFNILGVICYITWKNMSRETTT